jgi:hypothetical protein
LRSVGGGDIDDQYVLRLRSRFCARSCRHLWIGTILESLILSAALESAAGVFGESP